MEHYRLRKYRGPETWAQVRRAYVAGESAPSVARRFDVGLSNLRRRARAEGWTRIRIAEGIDLKPVRGGADEPGPGLGLLTMADLPDEASLDPDWAIALALHRATSLVGEGRSAEARALAQAVEALVRMWDAAADREWRRASRTGDADGRR